jgi:hypothetical protein
MSATTRSGFPPERSPRYPESVADQLHLSYWLRGYTGQNMLRHWEKVLNAFPYSRLSDKPSYLRIHGVAFSEPALTEEAFQPFPNVEAVVKSAKQFLHDDCAYQLETFWDLWQFDEEDWHIRPARATIFAFGPKFEGAEENIRIECGLDTQFLPDPEDPSSLTMAQSNIRSLLKLAHDLDEYLQPTKRQLWSESGENFAERLLQALEETEADI